MIEEKILKSEELAVYKLRALYAKYGYRPYKMSKFEEYDLYGRNKDFLVSDRVITFTDTDGRLLALKPDVTLSIIKNTKSGEKQKVCYNENVYRVPGGRGQFKEIMQAGLECIGELDIIDVYEVVSLAGESLGLISGDFVLDVSHMGIVLGVVAEISGASWLKRRITELIAERNLHELSRLIEDEKIDESVAKKLMKLAGLYGERRAVLSVLAEICTTPEELSAYSELKTLDELLCSGGVGDNIRYDFSVVNNTSYYNGIVFRGFLSGICESVLIGGSYDKLLSSMRFSGRGIGFALNLDLLSELDGEAEAYDADVLLLYGSDASASDIANEKRRLISMGRSVFSATEIPANLRYRELFEIK